MGSKRKKNRRPFLPVTNPEPSGNALARLEAHFSGPLPPPSMLAKYNEALPNGAERIVSMAERQSAHRESLESAVVNSNIQNQRLGSWFGFIIAMTAIGGGIYLIKLGLHGEGLASIIASLGALTAVFVIGKARESKELKKKADDLSKRM